MGYLSRSLAAATVLAAGAALAFAIPASATTPPVCTVSSKLLFAGNDGATFAVQKSPVNQRGIGMKAQQNGLHLTLSGGAQDADVLSPRTTLGDLIDNGLRTQESGNGFINIWFDTNRDGRFFDLSKGGTGTFTNASGDDYGSASVQGGVVSVAALNSGNLPVAPTKLADLDVATKGKINRDTPVLVDAGLNAPNTAGTVERVLGIDTTSCTTPLPAPTSAPAPPTNTNSVPTSSAAPTSSPTSAPTGTVVPGTVVPVGPGAALLPGFTQTGVVPMGAPNTGAA